MTMADEIRRLREDTLAIMAYVSDTLGGLGDDVYDLLDDVQAQLHRAAGELGDIYDVAEEDIQG